MATVSFAECEKLLAQTLDLESLVCGEDFLNEKHL